MVLVGVIAAGAGLGAGYFLRGSGESGAGGDRGSGLLIGRSPLLIAGEGGAGAGDGSGSGPEAPTAALSGGNEDLGFLGEKKVAGSIGEILEEAGPMGRWKEMMRLALEGDDAAVAAALEDLQELPQSIDTIVSKFFLYSRYAEGDPAAALDAMKHLSPDERDLASRSIMGGWAAEDPEAARAWISAAAISEPVRAELLQK